MADIVIQKPDPSNVTLALSTNQIVVQQPASNVVVLQTSGSYILQPATANTLGGVRIGSNLSIDSNGVLSATAGTIANFPWSNITDTPTTLAGYGITDGLQKLANVTYTTTVIPKFAASGGNRTLSGDVAVNGNLTSYSGFEVNNGTVVNYTSGQTQINGTDFRQGEFRANTNQIVFASNRFTLNSSGVIVSQLGKSQFTVANDGFTYETTDQNINSATLQITATGSTIDAGLSGELLLAGYDVTLQTELMYDPEQFSLFSVLNKFMADQLYLPFVKKN